MTTAGRPVVHDALMLRRSVAPTLGAMAAAAVLGLVASFWVSPTYQSELNLVPAEVFDEDVESPYRVAAYLESEAFFTQVPEQFREVGRQSIRAQVVESGPSQTRVAAYVQVRARAKSARGARDAADWVYKHVAERQRAAYEAMLTQRRSYEGTLEQQVNAMRADIASMQATLARLQPNPQVSAPAVLLLQAQMEAKQAQLLLFTKELRDSRISAAARTFETHVLAPPALPDAPVWPVRLLVPWFAVGLALLGSVAYFLFAAATSVPRSAEAPTLSVHEGRG